MACYRPLRIFNPSLEPTAADSIYLTVPCGKCQGCAKSKSNDWFVRMYYQYLETLNVHHGLCLYVTLTYRPQSLPMYNGVPVFNKDDIQRYIKRVRISLERFYQHEVDLKYIICSEYGEKGRPHYHGLIYINTPVSKVDLYWIRNMVRWQWYKYNGFVSFGRKTDFVKERGVVQSEKALHYVSKYINKDMYFPYDDDKLFIPKDMHPFHLQSKGFGAYMIDALQLDNNFDALTYGKVSCDNKLFEYAIPQYIKRKLLYDYIYEAEKCKMIRVIDKSTGEVYDTPYKEGMQYLNDDKVTCKVYFKNIGRVKYRLSDFGKEVRIRLKVENIKRKSEEFYSIFLASKQIINDDERLNFFVKNVGCTPQSLFDFGEYNFAYTHLCDKSFMQEMYNFAYYVELYHDKVYLPNNLYDPLEVYSEYTLDKAYALLHKQYDTPRMAYDVRNHYDEINQILFNRHFPEYYDTWLKAYNILTYFIGVDKQNKDMIDKRNYDNAKLLSHEVI